MTGARRVGLAVAAITMLVGVGVVAAGFIGHRSPVDWLDRNLDRTGEGAWLSQEPVVATADNIADAVRPASEVVNTWGVALRYGGGTVTVVPGPREGTASVYWDGNSTTRRHYRFGRYPWRGGDVTGRDLTWRGDEAGDGSGGGAAGGGAGRFAFVDASDPDVRTRRGEGFRGGGPGGGK